MGAFRRFETIAGRSGTTALDRGCVKTSARFHTSLFRSLLRGLRALRVEKIAKNFALVDRLQILAEFLHGLVWGYLCQALLHAIVLLWPRRVLIDPRGARCRTRLSRRNLVFGWVHVGPGP